jgi:hypothetical protein
MATIKIKIPPPGIPLHFSSSKDPSDVFDYEMDWLQYIQADTIASITVTGERVTIDSSSFSGKKVTFFVSGGNNGNIGTITVKIVTTNATPRTFERSFKVDIRDK